MSRARFFLEGEVAGAAGDTVALALADADVHHAVRVLRVAAGEQIDVVAPSGETWRAEVTAAGADGVSARLLEPLGLADAGARITLYQGLAKGEKMDAIVRQAVEAGVARIAPVVTARTVVRLDERRRADRTTRWRRIAHSAAEQSRRANVPDVDEPVTLSEAIAGLGAHGRVLVPWEDQRGATLLDAALAAAGEGIADVALVVGPEGGLDDAEVEALAAAGAVPVTLGPWIMRTETAAVASVAIVAAAFTRDGTGR